MAQAAPYSSRIPALVVATTIVVLGALVAGLTFRLRAGLRGGVLQREAESLHAVVLMHATTAPQLRDLGVEAATDDLFAGVLESSRLRGVLSVQMYDATGVLRAALPAMGDVAPESWCIQVLETGRPRARFLSSAALERAYGVPEAEAGRSEGVPLLQVAVPLKPRIDDGKPTGFAHYWISGRPVADEFARIDRGLIGQASTAFAAAALVVGAVLLWAFRRLRAANEKLVAHSTELAKANQELVFAAKTAAIGAISSHLIHEIKNPLLGIETFVRIHAETPAPGTNPESWKEATETAQRMRQLINQVVTVLQEETYGINEYALNAQEIAEVVQRRLKEAIARHGCTLAINIPAGLDLSARAGNLSALILVNLIGNAMDAAPGKAVELSAERVAEDVLFRVKDHGPGLPESVLDTLFQPQVSKKQGGSGIGLAISYQLAQQAGGRLVLDKTGPEGTQFLLMVPIAKA
jgi:signal transduction histidine kinase